MMAWWWSEDWRGRQFAVRGHVGAAGMAECQVAWLGVGGRGSEVWNIQRADLTWFDIIVLQRRQGDV